MFDRTSEMNVLLIAEACNPTWTSVPLVGYNFARALAEREEVNLTIATHVRNREGLETDPIHELAEVNFIDNEYIAGPLYRLSKLVRGGATKGWTTNTAFAWASYVAFEKQVHRRFEAEFDNGAFDLIHRVTPVSPTVGSPLASLTDVPMLLGPLNGGLPWPQEYPELRKKEKEWLVPLRKLYKKLPYYHSTYRHARAIIAGSRHTASETPEYFSGKRFFLPENGVDPDRFTIATEWPQPAGPFQFVTVGRLVPYKGMWLVLEAMRDSQALKKCKLSIIGDGPERENLESMVREFGLTEQVQFLGWLDQSEMSNVMRHSQAFVFPSLREFGGGVVLEAMASGLPSIIADYGGPSELLDDQSGILVPMAPKDEFVPNLRDAMEELAGDHETCRLYGENACRRVREEFTWAAKAEQISDFYYDILGVNACESEQESVTSASMC